MRRRLAAMACSVALLAACGGSAQATVAPIKGRASWYDYVPGEAAAGPALRRALGKNWRGKVVSVCADGRCIRIKISDWCQCMKGTSSERVIDLSHHSFSRLAPAWRGLIRVEVRP